MTARHAARRSGKPRASLLCLSAATIALIPNLAFAADNTAPTIRAAIGSDGAVSSVQQYAADGSASSFSGKLPISMKVTHTSSGSQQTFTYHVENTFSRTQMVNYDDTAGRPRHTTVTLQLPLVAQLGVDIPKSYSDVTATGATVTTSPDGTRHLLWSLVLFTPLGAAVQDVTVTASGSGSPVAELRAAAVNPTTTAGLSSASQTATAAYQQDDFWAGYANGGKDGLAKLSDGTGQMVDGLVQAFSGANQLHNGIVEAQGGAVQLDDGTRQAYNGSKKLTDGLGQIHGGLDQLAAEDGLPAALDGVKQLKAGVDAVLAGIGDDTTSNTLINGMTQLTTGLNLIATALNDPASGFGVGLTCAQDVLDVVVNGNATATADPCWASAPFNGTKPALPALSTVAGTGTYVAILQGVLDQAITPMQQAFTGTVGPTLTQLAAGAKLIRAGLSHDPGAGGADDPGGVKEGLQQIDAGLGKLRSGLADAVDGIDLLDAGSGEAFTGSKKLTDGLRQLSDGQHQVATGLPAAVDGTGQLADGLKQLVDGGGQVRDGIDQVNEQAVTPLGNQLEQASQNNHKQLAVLQAASNLAGQAPGGSGAVYVLSQAPLNASLASGTSGGGSHTGRNVGIGLGGAALLLVGLGGGYLMGRGRRRVTTHVA